MKKSKLPIYEMSNEEFAKFKECYLDGKTIDDDAIIQIRFLFSLGKEVGRIICDESHQHSYSCIYFENPEAGIVQRLVDEISSYQNKLKNIHEQSKVG